ncbi:MAG: hypothetical protein PCALPYG88_1036 [uncultured Paraburkholderia sp.]|uniref:hypothetical protein n=1 Tax=uncultured Paraburkholderia sp. TaxID=1822466 RepID=UPI0025947AC9|nr:hypothetical protein [uncultured Paraburkholderia sp.]CAH2894714.1 MAG: hypothetical protein PCALPYG08_1098 [uncultured Paraburkholderia sp.]CAH2912901.1 MAG: hypothetical protein PCALPYG88_1036 [uncultured Paraburkholderia sp.]
MHDSASKPACVYCKSNGPFSDEHLIPAGLGGDDRRFLLKGLVCADCNTKVFSPLEAAFLRSSPVAIARMFMQPTGRRRGSKRSTPKVDAQLKLMVTPDGPPAEVELGLRGSPVTLPQIIYLSDSECSVTGTDNETVARFLEKTRALLEEAVLLVEKRTTEDRSVFFDIKRFIWSTDHYVLDSQTASPVAPKVCVWQTSLGGTDHNASAEHARFFERREGQIVMRSSALAPDRALTFFRKAAWQIDLTAATIREIRNPLVHVGGMSVDIHIASRVVAKIGVNLLTFIAGDRYVRQPQFDSIKQTVLSGYPRLPIMTNDAAEGFAPMFAGVPEGLHAFIVSSANLPDGTFSIMVIARLYGSGIEAAKLGENLTQPLAESPVFFTVDYAEHVIERHTLRDFATKFPPLKPATMPPMG